MSSKSRSRNCSSSETESVTDISCEENIQAPGQQRFILNPGMYYQDTVFRTYSYAPPVIKNYPPAIIQQDLASTISTCVKPDVSSYRYRYYAPNAPMPASRLIKGEAAPKRYEQSMSFQNFPQRMYPTSQSYDGSFRNINFDPMFNETRVEQFNRPVSNMWQMAGSSANTTSSSQKFLNQYNPIETNPQGYGNYFQDKNVFNNTVPARRSNFTLKALGIIGLIFLVVITVAVVLSVVLTRSSFSARSLLKSDDVSVNETVLPRLFNLTEPVMNSTALNLNQTTDLVLNLTTVSALENTTLGVETTTVSVESTTLNMTENVTTPVSTEAVVVTEEMQNLTSVVITTPISETTVLTTTAETTTESSTLTSLETTTESTTLTTTAVSTAAVTTVQLSTTLSVTTANQTLLSTN